MTVSKRIHALVACDRKICLIKHPRGALRLSNARALYPQHQIRRRARRNGSALELLVAALVVVTSTAIYSLSRSGRGGVSDQKWPHTISPSVWIGTKSLQRDCNRGCVQLQEVGRQLFLAWGCSSLPTATRPCQRCPPSPRLEDSVCNFSSQGRRRCIKDKMHGKLEEGTAPNFDRAPDD